MESVPIFVLRISMLWEECATTVRILVRNASEKGVTVWLVLREWRSKMEDVLWSVLLGNSMMVVVLVAWLVPPDVPPVLTVIPVSPACRANTNPSREVVLSARNPANYAVMIADASNAHLLATSSTEPVSPPARHQHLPTTVNASAPPPRYSCTTNAQPHAKVDTTHQIWCVCCAHPIVDCAKEHTPHARHVSVKIRLLTTPALEMVCVIMVSNLSMAPVRPCVD